MKAREIEKREQSQSERFEQAARELGVDLDEDQLRRTLSKLATVKEGKDDVQDNSDEQAD